MLITFLFEVLQWIYPNIHNCLLPKSMNTNNTYWSAHGNQHIWSYYTGELKNM